MASWPPLTLGGEPAITSRSGRSTSRTTHYWNGRSGLTTSSRGCLATEGTSPGLRSYTHVCRGLSRAAIYMAGPGHGGPALVAACWLEGTYSEIYPEVSLDRAGIGRLFRQFSTPGGIPSHVSVTTPGSIHEGGELGYVLVHAFGSVMDNPDLLTVAVVGDGEAETGPLEGPGRGSRF